MDEQRLPEVGDDQNLHHVRNSYDAAQTAFANGDVRSAITFCQAALMAAHQSLASKPHDRLCAEVIALLLALIEGNNDLNASLMPVLDEAEAVAGHLEDRTLLVRLRRQRALVLLRSNSRSAAVRTLQEALDLAREAGAITLEWVILSEMGHFLVGEDLQRGLALQHQAHDMYVTRLADTHADSPEVQRLLHALEARIGVNQFDLGTFDIATEWLTRSVEGMRQCDMRADLPWALNYLAQVYMTIGRFEDAEAILQEAIALQDDSPADAVKANNLALLGKLYLEWERVEDADAPMRRGWAEAHAALHVGLISLVRNYYAELLLHPAYSQDDLAAAEAVLMTNLAETRVSAFYRSEIQALSLIARLALLQGNTAEALARSVEAISSLDRMGTLPALRTEEILWNHVCVLQATGRHDEAHSFLQRAQLILEQKAATIGDPEQRRLFYERIPLNRSIIAAAEPNHS